MNHAEIRKLSRKLSIVENNRSQAYEILRGLKQKNTRVLGITGPPGAGKSTLIAEFLGLLTRAEKKVAVLSVDPSSSKHTGALLGDRLRMQHYATCGNVYLRSVASRGHLGGLALRIDEMLDVLRAEDFDLIFLETVGVGQSEADIHEAADLTVLVLVPEAGDDIQIMKAGVMEVADVIVINKADREGADILVRALKQLKTDTNVFSTVARKGEGVKQLLDHILAQDSKCQINPAELAKRAWHLIAKSRMQDIDLEKLRLEVESLYLDRNFNLYKFVESKIRNS